MPGRRVARQHQSYRAFRPAQRHIEKSCAKHVIRILVAVNGTKQHMIEIEPLRFVNGTHHLSRPLSPTPYATENAAKSARIVRPIKRA
uniref:hypothetical protein n=1 Tax=Pannonibacter phragmitetus TaxID=121719 RepID=UPI000B960513|nr:hypothetical protein [Pannonibacter phragmitetus]